MNHELLALIAVIVTITLASAANVHIQLSSLESRVREEVFTRTKSSVRHSAYSLLWMLVVALLLVVSKPMVIRHDNHEIAASIVNGIALLVVLFSILVLTDLTQLAFKIVPPTTPDEPPQV